MTSPLSVPASANTLQAYVSLQLSLTDTVTVRSGDALAAYLYIKRLSIANALYPNVHSAHFMFL